MRGINQVILVGYVGQDAEVRFMPSGKAAANATLATSESWKDRQTGERQARTEWHKLVLFDRLGEIAGDYLKKGTQAYIEGSLQTRKWQDQSGGDRWTTEVVVRNLQLLGSRNAPEAAQKSKPGNPAEATAYAQASGGGMAGAAPSMSDDDFDDDIPFVRSDDTRPYLPNVAAACLERSCGEGVVW